MALVEPLHEDPMSWTLGDRIYKAMRVADLTAKDLSQQYKEKGLVVSRQRIGRWLDDERDPSATELVVLSEITGVDREWLLAFRCNTDYEIDDVLLEADREHEADMHAVRRHMLTLVPQ